LNAVFNDKNQKSKYSHLVLSDDNLKEIVLVFNHYNNATVQLSESKYTTISMVHPTFYTLLNNMIVEEGDEEMTIVLKKCLFHYTEAYIKKYIEVNESWYCAASFLDVRFKLFSALNPTARNKAKKNAINKLEEIISNGPPEIQKLLEIPKSNEKNSQSAKSQPKAQHFSLPILNIMDIDIPTKKKTVKDLNFKLSSINIFLNQQNRQMQLNSGELMLKHIHAFFIVQKQF